VISVIEVVAVISLTRFSLSMNWLFLLVCLVSVAVFEPLLLGLRVEGSATVLPGIIVDLLESVLLSQPVENQQWNRVTSKRCFFRKWKLERKGERGREKMFV
jgi:hypothetical protein